MDTHNMSIIFSSGISNLTEYNTSFDRGVLRICYAGRNRNNSFISKDTFERCMHTIYNCPIVCRYERETDSIGSHDMELVAREDGSLRIVNMTHPVGVIPESANIWWEEIEDESGVHEYLCADALLWKRQEAYEKIKRDGVTDESMEISIKDGEMIDGVYVIYDFEFTAFCLLESAQPCFESASLAVFACDDFKRQLASMMADLKSEFTLVEPPKEESIQNEYHLEGGEEALDLTLTNTVPEEIEGGLPVDATVEQPMETGAFALASQLREALVEALGVETVETDFGCMCRYGYVDHDHEALEVYCYDVSDWNLYGFAYSLNGDNVVIDFETKKRKKFTIVDFDEGESISMFASLVSDMNRVFAHANTQWTERFEAASAAIAEMNGELEELRQYKENVLQSERSQKLEEIFSRFTDLFGSEEYEQLKANCDAYSLEDIEEKCYAMRGRRGSDMVVFSDQNVAPKLPVVSPGTTPVLYGGIFEKYGIYANTEK